jgi:hypothetical protein
VRTFKLEGKQITQAALRAWLFDNCNLSFDGGSNFAVLQARVMKLAELGGTDLATVVMSSSGSQALEAEEKTAAVELQGQKVKQSAIDGNIRRLRAAVCQQEQVTKLRHEHMSCQAV